jgi:SAM-dependent methyltransferase
VSGMVIDVDDPGFPPELDPIASHSKLAALYGFRPPYRPEFFEAVADRLTLGRNDVILDLCCGRGELASGLSGFVGSVFAVDGSAEMLERRIARDNVVFMQADVNRDELALEGRVGHIVIGSAIHWVRQAALQRIVARHLAAAGTVVVTHTLLGMDREPHFQALRRLNAHYGNVDHQVDLWGARKLSGCGLAVADQIRLRWRVEFSLAQLLRIQLSYLHGEFQRTVLADLEGYQRDFVTAMRPFAREGKLRGTLINWGHVHTATVGGLK